VDRFFTFVIDSNFLKTQTKMKILSFTYPHVVPVPHLYEFMWNKDILVDGSIDFHSTFFPSSYASKCYKCLSFCIQNKKELHTGLEQLEGE